MLSNCVPVLVDCKVDTLQIDEDKIEEKGTKKTKAILVPNQLEMYLIGKKLSH